MGRKTSRPRYMWTASTLARSLRSASLASHADKWLKLGNVYNNFCVVKSSIWAKEGDIRSFLFTLLLQRAVIVLSVYEMGYDGLLRRVTLSRAFYHPFLALKMDIKGQVPLAQTLWLCPIQEYFWNHGFKKSFCPMFNLTCTCACRILTLTLVHRNKI